jgi:hypothetical protein
MWAGEWDCLPPRGGDENPQFYSVFDITYHMSIYVPGAAPAAPVFLQPSATRELQKEAPKRLKTLSRRQNRTLKEGMAPAKYALLA